MGWKTKSSPKTMRVTRKLAEEFVQMDAAPNDRPLSERRLQVYERMMKAGHFRPLEWSRAFCKETKGIYRVNGKHTSTLLSTIEDFPELYVTVYDYDCDNLDDVAKLYATFDSRVGARTVSDINQAFVGAIPNLRNIPMRTINAVVSGIPYFAEQDQYKREFSAAERAEVLLDEEEFCLLFHSLMLERPDTNVKLCRVPVVGAIYGTWKKDPEQALKFWRAVHRESGTLPELPDRKLARFLTTCSMLIRAGSANAKRNSKRDWRIATAREIFVKCLHGWNAWRRGEATNLQYHQKSPVPQLA